jgi:hypothetical protein
MNWAFDYLQEEGIVTAKMAGLMTWEKHIKFAEEMVSFARSHNSKKILINFLELVPILTVLEVDNLPKVLKDAGLGPEYKLAAVHDKTSPHFDDFKFFKNTASLNSIQVEIFSDINEAITWLKSQ